MKEIALLLIALCPFATLAQSPKPPTALTAKLVRLHYANPDGVAHLLSGMVVSAAVADNGLNAVVLRGRPDDVAKAEQMIQQLDVPQARSSERDIELTVYVIGAADKPATDAPAVPASLQPVVRQLKAIFPYSTYSLLNSMLIRSREGEHVDTTGMLKTFPAPPSSNSIWSPAICSVSYGLQKDSSAGTIHLSKFRFDAREPVAIGRTDTTQVSLIDVNVSTDFDLPKGQDVVVGKTDIDRGDAALFVVLSAKID